jgi:hypothetical protein
MLDARHFGRMGFVLPNSTPSVHSLEMSGYHIFETLFDGVGIWPMCVTSFEEAVRQAEQLAARTKHEMRVDPSHRWRSNL